MNINELTIQQAREICAMFACIASQPNQTTTAPIPQHKGQNIVVLDRGWVYVGDVTITGDYLRIENAKNIRVWGTTQGLGELISGPTSSTKLDHVGTVEAPILGLMHLIPCKGF